MSYFTVGEILTSLVLSLGFGALFAFAYTCSGVIIKNLISLLSLPKNLFLYMGRLTSAPEPIIIKGRVGERMRRVIGEITVFFVTLLFSVCLLLLSYYALDGSVRIYIIVLSVASFLLFKRLFSVSLIALFDKLFKWGYYGAVVALRVVTFPIFILFSHVYRKFSVNLRNLSSKIFPRKPISLDKA